MVNLPLRRITGAGAYAGLRLTNGLATRRIGNRLLGFVQKLHLPFGILLQAARKAAEEVAADVRHLAPGGLAAFEFGSLIDPRVAAVAVRKKYGMIDLMGSRPV